jgi:rod shape-determining protein MreC
MATGTFSTWGSPRAPRRRWRDVVICLVLIAVPALFLRANLKRPESLNFIDRGVLRISSPLQGALTAVIRGVVGIWDGYIGLVHVKKENDVLRLEIARLREEAARARREAATAAHLEELLKLRDAHAASMVAARVIAADASPHFRVVRVKLAHGAAGSVKKDMPVLAVEGLVGRVRRTYGEYADVQLAVDPASTFDAVVPRTGTHCLLDGIPGRNRYRCRLEAGAPADEVKVGDLLVTSQLNAGMPRDVTIGRVAQVEASRGTVHRDAEVVPSVDFARMTDVVVVLSVPPPAPPDSQPARRRARRGPAR